MEKILEKHFIKKYPKIFRDMYGPMDKTCMHWGIECGAGWWLLIDTLCANIQNYIDNCNNYPIEGKDPIPQLVAHQIKEKFGTLRYYHEGGDDYCDGMISMAEALSYWICENCGSMSVETGRTPGWIQSLCPKCSEEFKKPIVHDKEYKKLMAKVVESRENPKRSWKGLDEPLTPDDFIKSYKKQPKKGKK